MEKHETVKAEINAGLSSHCRFMSKQMAQEPILTLKGLSEAGIRRYFHQWPQVEESTKAWTPTVWATSSPTKLYELLGLLQWHRRSMGCCKLHLKAGALVGKKLLMIMPPFKAWFKRAQSGRTTLVIEFNVLVLHSTGPLDVPPGCHYPEEELKQSKALAVKALKEMRARYWDFPLCPGLLELAGELSTSTLMQKARQREREEEVRMRAHGMRMAAGEKRRRGDAASSTLGDEDDDVEEEEM